MVAALGSVCRHVFLLKSEETIPAGLLQTLVLFCWASRVQALSELFRKRIHGITIILLRSRLMKLDIFLSKTANIMAENRFMRLLVFLIAAVTIYNTVTVRQVLNTERIVIIPRGLNEKATVAQAYLSDSYIKQLVRNVIDTGFNYHPSNAKSQFDDLLTMFAPEAHQEAFNTFYDLGEAVVKANISSIAYIQDIAIDPDKKEINVTVISRKYKEDKKLEDKLKGIVINYKIANSQLQLLKITEKEDR